MVTWLLSTSRAKAETNSVSWLGFSAFRIKSNDLTELIIFWHRGHDVILEAGYLILPTSGFILIQFNMEVFNFSEVQVYKEKPLFTGLGWVICISVVEIWINDKWQWSIQPVSWLFGKKNGGKWWSWQFPLVEGVTACWYSGLRAGLRLIDWDVVVNQYSCPALYCSGWRHRVTSREFLGFPALNSYIESSVVDEAENYEATGPGF